MLDRNVRRNKIHRCRDGERNREIDRYIEKEKERGKKRERMRDRQINRQKERGTHREGMKLELKGVNVRDRKKKGERKWKKKSELKYSTL